MDSDFEFALKLQSQLLAEEENRQAQKSKAYNVVKKGSANSLIDPEWEVMDPNPDIYQLFQLFNQRFFWSKLGSVEVKWSPRMTSCAGICTYKGLRGCTVSLSLPLLKFRPRKDLVETLLHEMIHAYLFVTHNNKDRDGHGPEFHKHMYRINAEAGTKITVYHTFHDEVRHHKTHVWRCDGPCRSKHPFYGIVRRSMNRAPGPSDFWHQEHRQSCGGTFHKISEPEGFQSKKKKTSNEEPKKTNGEKLGNITNFFPSGPGKSLNGISTPPTKHVQKPPSKNLVKSPQPTLQNYFKSPTTSNSGIKTSNSPTAQNGRIVSKPPSNISGFGHTLGGGTITNYGGPSNNIHGFTNLSRPSGSGLSSLKRGGGTVMSNRGGTLLERPKLSGGSDQNFELNGQTKLSSPGPVFPGSGYTLSGSGRSESRLLSLIPPPKPKESNSASATTPKVEIDQSSESGDRKIKCPVCNIPIDPSKINEHLDECAGLESVMSATSDIIMIPDSDDESENGSSIQEDGAAALNFNSEIKCPNCDYKGPEYSINEHLDGCLSFDD